MRLIFLLKYIFQEGLKGNLGSLLSENKLINFLPRNVVKLYKKVE